MWIVPEREIGSLLTRQAAFDAVEQVFAAMAQGAARNFPVIREALGHEDALYGFKGGFDAAGGALGLKAGGYWPHNHARRGLINHQSTVFLFDPDSGRVRAMVGGNLLTALRTAAASAVSIRHLARTDARTLGIVGAGHQSAFQLRAALEQRPFDRVIGWNRDAGKLDRLAAIAAEAGLPFEAVSIEGMRDADVIITITSCFAPVLLSDHVAPGTHLACMGTDTIGKQEVGADLLATARVFTDEVAQSVTLGEAQHAVAAGTLSAEAITPLGAVINGSTPGRTGKDEVTLFDGTGVGLQDLAVAATLVEVAIEQGLAIEVDF
ncbi:ornithine cyclodeaminase family protein [Ponticoccus sp. SC2-23]|uniref:iminosuccinate reductase BhcD n=1 Tax=Alexandriicola marinus TaxID=2081710 RepID=UPI000FD7CDC3|nr:iminosuccinate reductase BhcD [Alexandriicola marinus]MBM1221649.1 ornithine cyclodeaminase family protein [Ponticoccus sp. SC6-9]MBM1226690.1 ornithine cyclodeaminase family protein [Ponticoccus sp. SC6-15]MBM1230641.1 ornithine cyclodeaminase family protein [Ponticoccus sp. SC6-38]MBM1235164.1 ornithine cyclodeaminase family protein [Ponticoccus sp. SC6-45]MBM1239662.1 ornithine cyclodeaminase family protein [Ponticoccus sp. SC6-49]MBM1243444.1 ornithine cyclodeaminase family protein [Po